MTHMDVGVDIQPIYDIEDKPPLKEAIPLGLQHVLAMFAGNVTVPIIIATIAGSTIQEKAFLVSCAMFVAGIASFVQARRVGPIGANLPIVMGTSFGFLPTSIAIVKTFGLAALFGAAAAGGVLEIFLGSIYKKIRKFFPPVVTGTVVMTIGLSLIPTGVKYFGGGVKAPDFGSPQNLLLGTVVLLLVIIINSYTKGAIKASAVLIALIVGYVMAIFMGKVSFAAVGNADWFSIPLPLKFGMEFHWPAILAMLVLYIVTTVETVGDINGITMGGCGREATEQEVSGGVVADGVFSIFAGFFNAMPNTSYSQNVGLISMTKVMSRWVVQIGAIFLILAGLFPKLGAIVAVIPSSVLGGATLPMFAFIALSGISLVIKGGLDSRKTLIVAISLGLGLGVAYVPEVLHGLPKNVSLLFEGGVALSTFSALILNIVVPEESTEHASRKAMDVSDHKKEA